MTSSASTSETPTSRSACATVSDVNLAPPVLIPAFNPGSMTGNGNNTYLFPDRDALLIDAGTGDSRHIAAIEAALASNAGRLTDVLVTHAHPDHASGAAALRRAWPAARFWKFPWPEEDRRLDVEFGPLSDGQRIGTGGAIEVIHTPGHSPDHCCFWLASQAVLFCGDLLIQGGTVVIPGSRGGNMTAYLESLQRVGRLDPRRVLPAHGQAIEQPLELIQNLSGSPPGA